MKRSNKPKTVYLPDKGETVYSMAALSGRTPEEQEEYDRKRKNRVTATRKERLAMFSAAVSVYGPMLLIVLASFGIAALVMFLFLKITA